IVCSLLVLNQLPFWQQRLLSDDFVQPPWHDLHPARLALAQSLSASPHFALAVTIDRLVDSLDLADLVASYASRGSKPQRPDLLLKVVLFLTQCGDHSPAAWFAASVEDRVVDWLLRGI